MFQSNGYPKSTIKKVLHAKPRPRPPPSQTEPEQQEKKVLFTLYIRGISEKIERACHQLGVRVIFISENTLKKSLMKVKERRPEETIKGVVYKVPCAKCNYVYIGEMGRSLSCRLKEHWQAMKTGNMNNGIAAHAWINEHHVDWEAAKVRAHEEHLWKRKVLEAIIIRQTKDTSNLDCGLKLNQIWSPLID